MREASAVHADEHVGGGDVRQLLPHVEQVDLQPAHTQRRVCALQRLQHFTLICDFARDRALETDAECQNSVCYS